LIEAGFLPRAVDILLKRGDVDCAVCRFHHLQGRISWQNDQTKEIRYTGLTCFERVTDRLNLQETTKEILHWVAHNRFRFKGLGPCSLALVEFDRLLSYKHPLSSAYGNEWEKISKDIWEERDRFTLSPLELGIVKTLVFRKPPYWTGSPTPTQRRYLNEILHHINKEVRDEWIEDVESEWLNQGCSTP
jgi:hypothetical protein